MKKIFLIFGLLIIFLMTGFGITANANQLHTITLEKNGDNYNIVLDTDSMSKVSKKFVSDNELVLNLSGIVSADTVNALYKGTETVDNLVIEHAGLNKLKIYISAPNIKSSSVIIKPTNGVVSLVGESFPLNKAIWTLFVLSVFCIGFKYSLKRAQEKNDILFKYDIKEREIDMYRKYRKSLDEGISLTSKDSKMNNMIRKIDRKIDERLSMSFK